MGRTPHLQPPSEILTMGNTVRIPLHISPDDQSIAANSARYDLLCTMMALNPKGFRAPPGGKPDHRKHARKPAGEVYRYAALARASMGA